MLDPSLLLDRAVLERTVASLPALRQDGGFDFSVPAALYWGQSDPEAYESLSRFFKVRDFVEPEEALGRLIDVGAYPWESPSGAKEEFDWFFEALGMEARSRAAQEVLFEEWFFLTHESWVVSRVKASFKAFVKGGELGVEVLNKLTRKTLRKDASHVVRRVDRLRALGKWIAVGGGAGAGLLGPIGGAVGAGVAGGFLLLDPPMGDSEG